VQGIDELHGFRRFIPLVVDYDDQYRRTYRITDVRATATPDGGRVTSGDPAGVSAVVLNENNDNLVVRIGSIDTLIEGTWRYTLDYVVHDTVDTTDVPGTGPVEELAWNVVGTAWDVPIGRVTLQATMPTPPMNVACYHGAFGSAERCELRSSGSELSLRLTDVDSFEAVTIYADFPQGTFSDATASLQERWTVARAFRATPLTIGGSALATAAVALGLGTLLGRQARDRRLALHAYLPMEAEPDQEGLAGFFERADGPVQFRPPDGMTPGLCGLLVDEKADALDVSATIVDLAVRGYLRIEQFVDERNKTDFVLRFLRDGDASLAGYEAILLARLRAAAAGDVVRISTLKTTFATQLAEVRTALYDESMRRKWFRRRPDHARGIWAVLGLLVLVAGGAVAVALAAFTTFGLFSLPLVAPGLILLATAHRMPSRTAEGRRQLELCVGYERFLEVADAEELRFTERQYQYVAGLPYAMVFGITDRWARVLADLERQGLTLTPTWYVGPYPGAPLHFGDLGYSMSDFGRVASQALSAPKPSSTGGGFGGGFSGGFSGGGGGGGGGGGW